METIQLIIIAFIVVVIGGVFLGPMLHSISAINSVKQYSETINTSSANYINHTFPERIYNPAVFNNSLTSEQMTFLGGDSNTRYLSIVNTSVFNTFYMDNSWFSGVSPMPKDTNLTLKVGGRLITKLCYQEQADVQANCEVYYGY